MPQMGQASWNPGEADHSTERSPICPDWQTTPQKLSNSREDLSDTPLALVFQPIYPQIQRPSNYEIISAELVTISELEASEVIIVVMGSMGVGKSTFIQTLSGVRGIVGHGLESYTSQVSAYRVKCSDDINVVLVDTPGFDDTRFSDFSDLEITTRWIQNVGKRGLQVSGFLYLHRVSDNRMGGKPRNVLEFVEKSAGTQFFPRVTLITTMWPESAGIAEMEESERREEELQKEYWATMILKGSKVARFDKTRASAKYIVDRIIAAEMQWRPRQQELERLFGALPSRQQLHPAYRDLVERRDDLIQRLRVETERKAAGKKIAELQQQIEDESRKWGNARKEVGILDSTQKRGWRCLFCFS